MEYYSYVNIFEQKGVAYILLLSFLVLAVLLIRYLSGPPEEQPLSGEKSANASSRDTASNWRAAGSQRKSP
jgi:hypothetical protein